MSESATTSVPDALLLTHCPHCDYALTGLPPEGICPECGKPYDQRFVILTGDAAGARAQFHNASGRAMWRLVIVQVICLALIIWPQFMTGRGHRRTAIFYLALIALPIVVALAKRFANPRRGSVQVILGPQGAAQIDTLDRNSALSVIDRWGFIIAAPFIIIFMLSVFPNGSRNGMLMGLIIVPLILLVAWIRRRGRVKSELADGKRVDFVPWSMIEDVDLTSIGHDRWNLRLASPGTFFRAIREHVNADVFIDPGPAAKLGLRIHHWRKEAPR